VNAAATRPNDLPVPSLGPEEYTRGDEELLRKGLPAARVAVISTGALSVGVSQRDDSPNIERARRLGIPIVRRSTGGLGIWHAPGDLVWSLVLPRSDVRVGRDFSKAYARLGTGPVRFLDALGVQAAWRPPLGLHTECCLLSGRGSVLTVAGRALGGAAQHITRAALLHHGVLPYRLDPSRLQALFDLSPEVVVQSLTGLEEVAPGLTPTVLAERLHSVLASEIDSRPD
jgi:lipoate-protein ligase A